MAAIFLSHSSKDDTVAGELKSWLEARGHTVFLDFDPEAGIRGGANWEQTIYDRLRICRVVIPLLTLNWLSSKWCFAEVVHARSSGKTILPLRVADCDASEVFPAIQQIDLARDAEEGYQRLELALQDVFSWDASRPRRTLACWRLKRTTRRFSSALNPRSRTASRPWKACAGKIRRIGVGPR
jgi:hypothetical protein